MLLENKRAVVTGAANGIGKASFGKDKILGSIYASYLYTLCNSLDVRRFPISHEDICLEEIPCPILEAKSICSGLIEIYTVPGYQKVCPIFRNYGQDRPTAGTDLPGVHERSIRHTQNALGLFCL